MRLAQPGAGHSDQRLEYAPLALFVQFYDKTKEGNPPRDWELAGLEGQPGVYCVTKQPEYWYVDGQGGGLRVRRHQFPVAPDFSRTAYSMQGFTLPACLVDLRFDKNTDPVTGYVAMSRVQKCEVH